MVLSLLLHTFALIFTSIYVNLCGSRVVKTRLTNNDLIHEHTVVNSLNQQLKLEFLSRQLCHTVYYTRCKFISTVYYTYVVEVIQTVDLVVVGKTVGHYPHMCFKFLHRGTLPHRFAINAIIDSYR